MTNIEQSPYLCMEKKPLTDLPEVILPPGYSIRPIAIEEGYLWEQVMDQSFGDYGPGTFQEIMVENYDYDPERVRIMFDENGRPCATGTSWRRHYRWGTGIGYVLFIGVVKSYQRRGLGYQIVLHVLHDFVKHGFECAIVEPDNNIPALKTYLKLGFIPRIVHPQQYEQWDSIFAALSMEPICFPREIRPPTKTPHPPQPWPYELKMQARK
jgi:mycothiol synthase